MSATHFKNISIFDGTGSPEFTGEVLVEGNRITAVARGAEQLQAPPGADVIDGRGGTLMPGLIEPHCHLTFPVSVGRPPSRPRPEQFPYVTAHNAKVTLDYGYTSAYSAGAFRPEVEVALRDEIKAGYLPGPRLKASSSELTLDSARPGWTPAQEVEAFITESAKLGVDNCKMTLSAPMAIDPNRFEEMPYGEAELAAASRLAKEHGLNLNGHAYSSESVQLAIRYGFRALFHCNFVDEPTLDLMEEHKDEFWVVPAHGVVLADLKRLTASDGVPPDVKAFGIELADARRGVEMINEAQLRVVPEMRKRGIQVLPGGDYGLPGNPHGRNAWELELMQTRFGYAPAEVLAAATSGGAALMAMADELGQVKPGYLADLLLVNGDPLSDITVLQDSGNLSVIMQEGRFHKRPQPSESYLRPDGTPY